MKFRVFLAGIAAALLIGTAATGSASPLADFAKGSTAVDVTYNVHAFEGGQNNYSFGITNALGNGWALNFRQAGYSPIHNDRNYDAVNREFNLIRKLDDTWQVYVGYSDTKGSGNATHWHKNVVQGGILGNKKINDHLRLFVNLGGGQNVTNIEFGLAYRLSRNLEASTVYRHLTVEKLGAADNKLNLRSFNLGLTWKL